MNSIHHYIYNHFSHQEGPVLDYYNYYRILKLIKMTNSTILVRTLSVQTEQGQFEHGH